MKQFYKISRERSGELFAFSSMLIGSFFPILSILAFQKLTTVAVASASMLIAAGFFALVLTGRQNWHKLFNPKAFFPVMTASVLELVFWFLMFWGFSRTSAGNGSLVSQMEVWFSFLFFGLILRKEKYTKASLLGALLMFIGVCSVIFNINLTINFGDLVILLAVMLAPIANFYQQASRRVVSSEGLLFVRNLFGGGVLLLFALGQKMLPTSAQLLAVLPFLLANGILVFGLSKIFWIESIHRLPVAKAISLTTFSPVFTLFYAFLVFGDVPTFSQLAGLPFLVFGAILITRKKFLQADPPLD